jgi:hypothetical protein
MAKDDFRRIYNASEFPLLQGPLEAGFDIFKAQVNALDLNNEIGYFELVDRGGAVLFYWDEYPGEDDLNDVQGVVSAFVGGGTSEAPVEINNWDPVTAITTDLVLSIDYTTPPLAHGTYQVILNNTHRLQAETPNQGSRLFQRVDRSDGGAYEQNDHTTMFFTVSKNLPITFQVEAGQTIRVRTGVALITGAGGVAEVTGSRATIDKIS